MFSEEFWRQESEMSLKELTRTRYYSSEQIMLKQTVEKKEVKGSENQTLMWEDVVL